MSSSNPSPHPVLGFLTVISDPQVGIIGGYLVLNWAGRPLEFHCTAPIKPNRAQQILYGPTLEPYLYGEQIGRALVSKTQHPPTLICTDVAAALALRMYVDWPVVWIFPAPPPGAKTQAQQSPISGGDPNFPIPGFPLREEYPEGPWSSNTPNFLGVPKPPGINLIEQSRSSAAESGSNPPELLLSRSWRLDPPHPGIGRLVVFSWGKQHLAVLENSPQDYPRVQEALAALEESFDLAEPFGRIRDAIEEARRGG